MTVVPAALLLVDVRGGISLSIIAAALCLFPGTASAMFDIPARPAESPGVWDTAGLLTTTDRVAIEKRQAELNALGREVVVVTIRNMRMFGGHPSQLEEFSRAWFDAWGIGRRADNSGILLLISSGDRVARIELGADWGHRYDDHCERIMQNQIVPEFKAGRSSQGILAGFSRLASLAEKGPSAGPPAAPLMERIKNQKWVREQQKIQPGPFWATPVCIGAGILLIILAMVYPKNMKVFLIGGFALVLAGISIYILLMVGVIIVSMFTRGGYGRGYHRGGWGSGGGGFSGGGGGFSGGGGGFSGGGGASGSW